MLYPDFAVDDVEVHGAAVGTGIFVPVVVDGEVAVSLGVKYNLGAGIVCGEVLEKGLHLLLLLTLSFHSSITA